MHFEHLSRLRQSGCSVAGVKGLEGGGGGGGGGGGAGGGGCTGEKKGTPATRAASFEFHLQYIFQLSQLSLQRPIRIRRTLFSMTGNVSPKATKICQSRTKNPM